MQSFDISAKHIVKADLDYSAQDTTIAPKKRVVVIDDNPLDADNSNANDYNSTIIKIRTHMWGAENSEKIGLWAALHETFVPWIIDYTGAIHSVIIGDHHGLEFMKLLAREHKKVHQYMTTMRGQFQLKTIGKDIGANVRSYCNQMEISMKYCNAVIGTGDQSALFALFALENGGYACIKISLHQRQLIALFARCFERTLIINTPNDYTYIVGVKYIAGKWKRFISCDHSNNIFRKKYLLGADYHIIDTNIAAINDILIESRVLYYEKLIETSKLLLSERAELFPEYTAAVLEERAANKFNQWAADTKYPI